MTSPDPAAILAQINAAREQTYQNIALAQGILTQANQAAAAAAQDRAAIQAIAQQTVSVDTSVGTRVFAGDTMIFGDTGWRDVTADLVYGWAAEMVAIRRVGGTVEARVLGLNGEASTAHTFFHVPLEGFAPRGPEGVRISATSSSGSTSADWVSIGVSGSLSQIWRTDPSVREAALSATYLTDSPWPTSLPGTAI